MPTSRVTMGDAGVDQAVAGAVEGDLIEVHGALQDMSL
jgi:hypothetical protein